MIVAVLLQLSKPQVSCLEPATAITGDVSSCSQSTLPELTHRTRCICLVPIDSLFSTSTVVQLSDPICPSIWVKIKSIGTWEAINYSKQTQFHTCQWLYFFSFSHEIYALFLVPFWRKNKTLQMFPYQMYRWLLDCWNTQLQILWGQNWSSSFRFS